MIGICFFLEEHVPQGSGVIAYPIEAERWIYNARNLGATHVIIIDRTQYRIGQYLSISDSEIEVVVVGSLAEAQALYDEVDCVYLENSKTALVATPLAEFEHPESVLYVIGGNYCGIVDGVIKNPVFVTIDAPDLFAEAAGVVVLWDRRQKCR